MVSSTRSPVKNTTSLVLNSKKEIYIYKEKVASGQPFFMRKRKDVAIYRLNLLAVAAIGANDWIRR